MAGRVITAKDLVEMIEARHSKDVVIPECKDGPTGYSGCMRMDAWVLVNTWTDLLTIGYETKVSRADFAGDQKWREYLGWCSEFYFVCPPKVILPDEVPPEAGLLWSTANATRLYRKKVAPRRDVPLNMGVMRYILMHRVEVCAEHGRQSRADYFRRWLERRGDERVLGRGVSERLLEIVQEARQEARDANRRAQELERVEMRLDRLGIDYGSLASRYDVEREIDKLAGKLPPGILRSLRTSIEQLERVAGHVEEIQNGALSRAGVSA